jgi:hypothetical protein
MNVCVGLLFVLSCVQATGCEPLIPCPRSPTDYVKDQETEKAVKA